MRIDDEEDVPYVYMEDPSAPEITFVRAPCPSKEVLYVRCSDLGTYRFYNNIINCYVTFDTRTYKFVDLFFVFVLEK